MEEDDDSEEGDIAVDILESAPASGEVPVVKPRRYNTISGYTTVLIYHLGTTTHIRTARP